MKWPLYMVIAIFCVVRFPCIGLASEDIVQVQETTRTPGTFLVLDSLHLKGKPNLREYGIRPFHIIYASTIWPKGQSRDQPRENAMRALARRAAQTGRLVCIDIEHWPTEPGVSDDVVAESIQKYIQVADWMHHAEPGLRIGFYGVPPVREYWAIMSGPEQVTQWQEANRRLEPLARHVDVIFPSLYTFYDDPEGWVKFAEANLKEARRYGKKVYAFLWPVYHDSNKELSGQFVPGDYWRLQLETCRQYADGIVLWAHPDQTWDEDAPWWVETKQFLEELR